MQSTNTLMARDGKTEALALFCAAGTWGLAAGISLSTRWIGDAPPDQLSGYMTTAGLDARGPMRAILTIIVVTLAAAILARPMIARFTDARSHRWAAIGAAIALASSLWPAVTDPYDVVMTVVFPVAAALALMLARELEPHWTRHDVILIPSALSLAVALTSLVAEMAPHTGAMLATAIVVALRLVVGGPRYFSRVPPHMAFALAPLAIIFEVRAPLRSWPTGDLMAIALVIGSPLLLAAFLRDSARVQSILRWTITAAVLPIFAIAYAQTYQADPIGSPPRANFFEDGHSLLPASEMLRGEKPYRDIVPGHGLLSDGFFDYLVLRAGGEDAGDVLAARRAVAALVPAALYALAIATTGSANVAILAVLFAVALQVGGTPWVRDVAALDTLPKLRILPALVSLSFAAGALRLRKPKMMGIASAVAVLAGITSLEFGVYSAIAVMAAVAVSGARRSVLVAAISSAAGAASAGAVALLALAAAGVADDFLIVTIREVLPLSEVYSVGFISLSDDTRRLFEFPGVLALLLRTKGVWIIAWASMAVATAVFLGRGVSRRTSAVMLVAFWGTIAAISFAERLNVYFMGSFAVFAVGSVSLLWRRRSARARTLAALLGTILVIMATPSLHFAESVKLRRHGDPAMQSFARYERVPRAGGALYPIDNLRKFEAVREFAASTLRPGETFFDFANMPIVYFLLDIDCPIRQYEVPFFQPRELQEEVVARLEQNRSVRAALITFPNHGETAIDGVANQVRAPIVWQYLQSHFVPAFRRDGVEIWMRRD